MTQEVGLIIFQCKQANFGLYHRKWTQNTRVTQCGAEDQVTFLEASWACPPVQTKFICNFLWE
jgi:hypothetical protein